MHRVARPELDEIIALVLRGGWPGVLGKSVDQARAVAREYIENVVESDINRLDDVVRDPVKVRKCLRSLAVVVGLAGAAYRRPDGVYVLPLTALGPK